MGFPKVTLFRHGLELIFSDNGLTSQELKRLAEHKYAATCSSFLDTKIMQKWWCWLVERYPLWLAPNLLTLFGLLCNISACLLVSFFSPDATKSAPGWTYFLCAVGLFIYQSLDATDGKQARRTNSASPLGELFDHGCDSLSQVFVTLEVCQALLLGDHPTVMIYICVMAIAMFYCAHWQTYCSGTLKFGKFDVTEAQFVVIFACIVTVIFGGEIWKIHIPFLNIEFRLILLCWAILQSAYQFFQYLSVVFTGGVGKNGSTVANTSVLFPLIPLLIFCGLLLMIYSKSTTGVFQQHIVLYCVFMGLVGAKITNRIIVAHMSRSELRGFDSILFGPFILFLNQYFNNCLPEYPLLLVAFAYCLINFCIYCAVVCDQMADYLQISILSLKKRTPKYISKPVIDSPRGSVSSYRGFYK